MHLGVVIARSLSVDGDLPPIDALTHDDHAIWPNSRKFLAPTRIRLISRYRLGVAAGYEHDFWDSKPNDANFSGTANLYTISTTGAATLVGNTGVFFGSIAFARNGTLYMAVTFV
jgi:hypothetical protein